MPFRVLAANCGHIRAGGGAPTGTIFLMDNLGSLIVLRFGGSDSRENPMTFDEGVAKRIRSLFLECPGMTERKMFGGLAFMYRGHMLAGIVRESLMARIGPAEYEQTLKRPHFRKMDCTGRPMKGYVHADPAAFESGSDLGKWVELCIRFNASQPPE